MTKSPSLFGLNLRRVIKADGRTYTKAAQDFGITLSFLNQLMRGEREPSMETVASICSVLKISRAELFEDESATTRQLSADVEARLRALEQMAYPGMAEELQKLRAENERLNAILTENAELIGAWKKGGSLTQPTALYFLTGDRKYLPKLPISERVQKVVHSTRQQLVQLQSAAASRKEK